MSPDDNLQRQLEWHRQQIEDLERKAAATAATAAEEREQVAEDEIQDEEDSHEDCRENARAGSFRVATPLFRQPTAANKNLRSWLLQWPRAGSCMLGVVLPLFGLIGLCMVFGLWVARYEAPYEIQSNDAKLQARANALKQKQVLQIGTTLTPKACMEAFMLNKTDPVAANGHLLAILIQTIHNYTRSDLEDQVYQVMANYKGGKDANDTLLQLHEWMSICGSVVDKEANRILGELVEDFTSMGTLTFDWIRCVPGANGLGNGFDQTSKLSEKELVPALLNQSTFYQGAWNDHQGLLRHQHAKEFQINKNITLEEAMGESWYSSIAEATGGNVCELNPAAAGWFWFTILSTMGYGNQHLMTNEGRALVYTLGFVSIILFGFILGMAGIIISALVDDFLVSLHLPVNPWAVCLLWGALYYAWMAITGAVVLAWKHHRLQDTSFQFQQGYWFAYISSTTVGLGDVILEPLVLQSSDMITFPFLFLVNFVFLSAFLNKLGELCSSVGSGHVVAQLVQKLEETNTFRRKQNVLKSSMYRTGNRQLQISFEDTGISLSGEEPRNNHDNEATSSSNLPVRNQYKEAAMPAGQLGSFIRDDMSYISC